MKSEHGVDAVMEESAVGDSSGNGAAELAFREVKAKVRTLRSEVDRLHGLEIKSDSPVVTWLVEHAVNTINIGRRANGLGAAAWPPMQKADRGLLGKGLVPSGRQADEQVGGQAPPRPFPRLDLEKRRVARWHA